MSKCLFFLCTFFFLISPLWAREFPLCLYGVNNPADLKIVKKAGFSCIQTYQTNPAHLAALASKAQKLGIKVVFSPGQIIGTPYEEQAKSWPVLAWYLVDEPDVKQWSREKVIDIHRQTKLAFPNHSTTLVIGQGKTKLPFYDIADAMMVDWYPVPHLPLTSFGDQVHYTHEGMKKTGVQMRPLWGVVQIFDWKNFKQYRPDNDRIGRFPTEEEIRFMSYDGILNGATGLFYFTFNHQGKPLPQSAPEYWERVKTVVKKLANFKKVFENGTIIENPVPVKVPIKMQTWQYEGHIYSVLVNASDTPQNLPLELTDKVFKTIYGGKKETTLAPYQVLLLERLLK